MVFNYFVRGYFLPFLSSALYIRTPKFALELAEYSLVAQYPLINRATNRIPTMPQYMCIYLSSPHILMAKQILHRADVIAILKQVRRKRMSHRVTGHRFNNAGFSHSAFYGLL